MARDVEEEIRDEEEYEKEDADDKEEQAFDDDFSDDEGENMAPTAKGKKSGVEFICLKCGLRKKGVSGKNPEHDGEPMTPVDFISK